MGVGPVAPREVSPGVIDQVIAAVGVTHGYDLSAYDPSFLASCVTRRMSARGISDEHLYVELLRRGSACRACCELADCDAEATDECAALRGALLVSHSEFFRDPLTWAVLGELLLPPLLESCSYRRRGLRVWSAGCARGQEAYSMALLLEELNAGRAAPVPYRIFGTDVCGEHLATAAAGVYRLDELKSVPLGLFRKHFAADEQGYVISSPIKDHVDFSEHDLLDGSCRCPPASIYGEFDIILCANVLIYYADPVRRRVLESLEGSLVGPPSFLVVAKEEAGIVERAANLRLQPVLPKVPVFRRERPDRMTRT